MGFVLFRDDHPFPKLRYKPGDGIIQADLAFIRQHHDRGAGEHLVIEAIQKHVVFAHRLFRVDIGKPDDVLAMNLCPSYRQ